MNNFFPSSILVVASHPDDEVLMAGGTMARNFKSGGKNYVIFMTNGVGSRENLDPISQSNERLEEARKANRILGSEILDCYDFPDNALDSISLLSIVKVIEKHISFIQPDYIITHSQNELNIDHQLVGRAVITANRPNHQMKKISLLLADVPSSSEWSVSSFRQKSNFYIDITSEKELKYKAINCYSSELREAPNPRSIDLLKSRDCLIGSEAGLHCAEGFYLHRLIL